MRQSREDRLFPKKMMSSNKRPITSEPGAWLSGSKRLRLDHYYTPTGNGWGSDPAFANGDRYEFLGTTDSTPFQQYPTDDGTAQGMPAIAVQDLLAEPSVAEEIARTSGASAPVDASMMHYNYTDFNNTPLIGIEDSFPTIPPPLYEPNQGDSAWYLQQDFSPNDTVPNAGNHMDPDDLMEPRDWSQVWDSLALGLESEPSFHIPETTNCTSTPAEGSIVPTPSWMNTVDDIPQMRPQLAASISLKAQAVESPSEQNDVDDGEAEENDSELEECDTCFGEVRFFAIPRSRPC
ncbi:hypothetical protein BDW74DRAFT_18213 [Aspergillus multicolor]|uniref:uncharacterized protein n=1 Tax=Aspergillus multicolor TaxID=41759 RepID=UPI003CCD8144